MVNIWVINGPNINFLGTRCPSFYGSQTFNQLIESMQYKAAELGATLDCRQSNHEGDLIDWIQDAKDKATGLIINAGGLSHNSISIHDALEMLEIPKIEVHITNIYAREEFRQKSLISPAVHAMIAGFGQKGYILALEHIVTLIKAHN